jgi:hypothetical protein
VQAEINIGEKTHFGRSAFHAPKYAPSTKLDVPLFPIPEETVPPGEPPPSFTEIICSKAVEVRETITEGELFGLAEAEDDALIPVADWIAGVIGLRLHRQLVLDLVNDSHMIIRGEHDSLSQYYTPPLEILKRVRVKRSAAEILKRSLAGSTGMDSMAVSRAGLAIG